MAKAVRVRVSPSAPGFLLSSLRDMRHPHSGNDRRSSRAIAHRCFRFPHQAATGHHHAANSRALPTADWTAGIVRTPRRSRSQHILPLHRIRGLPPPQPHRDQRGQHRQRRTGEKPARITHLRGKRQDRRRRNQLAKVPRALHGRHVGAGAGCGIIADSEPANEYQETELKLSGMQAAIRVRDAAADANARGTAKVSTSSTVE